MDLTEVALLSRRDVAPPLLACPPKGGAAEHNGPWSCAGQGDAGQARKARGSPEGEEVTLALTDSDLLSLLLSGEEVNQIARFMNRPCATFPLRALNHASATKIGKALEHMLPAANR